MRRSRCRYYAVPALVVLVAGCSSAGPSPVGGEPIGAFALGLASSPYARHNGVSDRIAVFDAGSPSPVTFDVGNVDTVTVGWLPGQRLVATSDQGIVVTDVGGHKEDVSALQHSDGAPFGLSFDASNTVVSYLINVGRTPDGPYRTLLVTYDVATRRQQVMEIPYYVFTGGWCQGRYAAIAMKDETDPLAAHQVFLVVKDANGRMTTRGGWTTTPGESQLTGITAACSHEMLVYLTRELAPERLVLVKVEVATGDNPAWH